MLAAASRQLVISSSSTPSSLARSGSADAGVEKTSPQRLLRSHLTLVLTLIPIVLSAMRFSAVANGDRATLVRQLSALDVKSTLLGTFVWLLPTAFGVVAAMCWIRWVWLRAAPERAASTFGWRS